MHFLLTIVFRPSRDRRSWCRPGGRSRRRNKRWAAAWAPVWWLAVCGSCVGPWGHSWVATRRRPCSSWRASHVSPLRTCLHPHSRQDFPTFCWQQISWSATIAWTGRGFKWRKETLQSAKPLARTLIFLRIWFGYMESVSSWLECENGNRQIHFTVMHNSYRW